MENNIKLAIVGSRTFSNYEKLKDVVDNIPEIDKVDTIVSGDAKGTDSLGERYADEYALDKLIFPADWKKCGKKAGFLRNVDIIKNCDICVAFWDGESHGTKHDIELCKQYNKPCYIFNFITNQLIKNF